MTRGFAMLFGLGVLPLIGANDSQGPKQSFTAIRSERFPFRPGGTIRVDHSFGYLTVEGWDEPEVEVTVSKSTDRFRNSEWEPRSAALFDQVRVHAERRSDNELVISTVLPHRNSPFSSVLPSGRKVVTPPVPRNTKRGVTVEYTVRVPRVSRLSIRHDNGYVSVSDVAGDIEIDSHTGDMIVMLPDPGPYAIDARTQLGSVSSDLIGRSSRYFVTGSHFTYAGQAGARHIQLRMGRGCITVKTGPPSGPFWRE